MARTTSKSSSEISAGAAAPAALSRSGSGPGKRDILDAAAAAFTRAGYAATSIDDIADELGATKGRVYHYYRAKADIFLDVILAGMAELIQRIEPVAAGRDLMPADRLWRMAYEHADLMMTSNSFQRVAVQGIEMHRLESSATQRAALEQVIELRDQYEGYFAQVIQEGRGAKVFRDVDVPLATRSVLGALNWISIWYDPDRGGPDTVARVSRANADFVLNALLRGGE